MFLRIVSFVALLCFPSVGSAQEGRDWSPAATFLIAEGLIGANAFLASKSPRGWGGVQAVLVPVLTVVSAGDPKAGPADPWLILLGGGALAAYNLTVDTGKTSEGQIFKANFVALNALVGVGLAVNHFTGKSDQNKKVSLAYVPGARGGNLVFSYRF
jgi:hypothetical protein